MTLATDCLAYLHWDCVNSLVPRPLRDQLFSLVGKLVCIEKITEPGDEATLWGGMLLNHLALLCGHGLS